jgi:hypothetical protein
MRKMMTLKINNCRSRRKDLKLIWRSSRIRRSQMRRCEREEDWLIVKTSRVAPVT